MFHKIQLLTLLVFTSFFLIDEGFASITKTYTPSPKITLTGTTTNTRFDVAEVLYGSSFSGAYIDTTTQNMSGAFYMNGIGWALMSSGSYQVELDCGAQSLSSLTSQCQFTGSGWSENIGELGFSSVSYNPSTATLSGSISSFAGDFSVEGIVMPLKPVEFNGLLVGLTAYHDRFLSISNAGIYAGEDLWRGRLIPGKNPTYPQYFLGTVSGIFNIDMSLADTYTIEITDPHGSVTRFSGVEVHPDALTQTLYSATTPFVEDFCSMNPTDCTDIYPRTPTVMNRVGSNIKADGVDQYSVTLKPRDTYGNIVNTGSLYISYTGTVSKVQIPSAIWLHPYIGTQDLHDALIIDGYIYPIYDMSGNWWTTISVTGVDINYSIKSVAPTNTTDNIVVLDRIAYIAPDTTETTVFTDTTLIEFVPAYTASITAPSSIYIGDTNVFQGTLTPQTSLILNPSIITLLQIGNGNLAYFDALESTPAGVEASPDSDWYIDSIPSSIRIATPPAAFSFSGVYRPLNAYPEIETIYYYGLIQYNIGGDDIVYPAFADYKTAEYSASRVKILGQNNARSEYGTVTTTSNARSVFMDGLRKQISLLSRGRESTDTYTDVGYRVYTGDISINDTSFDTHQTIISIGGDVTITDDIDKDIDYPLAIIALADGEGHGGNIIIDSSVKDITAGLFAEHAVKSSGDNQLYIYGALVSGNTLGDTTAGICPYYVAQVDCTNPQEYDLEYLRGYDNTDISKRASNTRATDYPASALIIEYDMRLQRDPPLGLPQ